MNECTLKEIENTYDININIFYLVVKQFKDESSITKDHAIHEAMYDINVNEDNNEIFPKRLTKQSKTNHIDLLLLCNESKEHYVWINNFSRLCFNVNKHNEKKYFCKYCINGFTSEDVLSKHEEECKKFNGSQAVEMPKSGEVVKFINYDRTVMTPFVIYADFEAIVVPLLKDEETKDEEIKDEEIKDDPLIIKTTKLSEHKACSYGYKVVCTYDDKLTKSFKTELGPDCISSFLKNLFEEEKYIKKEVNKLRFRKIKNTRDARDLTSSLKPHTRGNITNSTCMYCSTDKADQNYYDIYNNEYKGVICEKCHKQMKITQTIPVVFQNLKGYDSHLIIKELAKFDKKINVIPLNMQKYLSFEVSSKVEYNDKTTGKKKEINVKGLRFIDSYGFMNESLSSLVYNLNASCTNYEKFNYLSSEFKCKESIAILTRKGVYPYSYMTDFSKFDIETSKLKKEDFKNDLNDTDISDEDYSFYNKVCTDFNLKTMKDYHDLYLKTDVLLLADVFENFRETCYRYYELDPLHYYSAPGLAWDSCLKKTKIQLELLTDVDMNLMIDKGCRGGMSIITQRYAKANNKYLGYKYNKNEESSYIEYLDANALYSWAMTQSLPYAEFKWIDPEDYNLQHDFNAIEIGHILEVDLEYPESLHDTHNEYPICCEHINVQKDE